jgi:two-component system chemotaxis sensor kinase CheA
MSFDLARFHAVFFAESLEQLDAMEAELLRPDVERADSESINTIFRAAHSIKGASATFEFNDIAGLTHVLETLLDEVRSGQRPLDQPLVDLLLESVDCLRELLLSYQSGTPAPSDTADAIRTRVEKLIGTKPETEPEPEHVQESGLSGAWRIAFKPHANLMRTGNDPYRLIRELAAMGELSTSADLSKLPLFSDLDPESIYINWEMLITTTAPRRDIDELFEWVEEDCDLTIEPDEGMFGDIDLSLDAPELKISDGKLDLSTEAKPEPPPPPTSRDFTAPTLGRSIRVDTEKIDQLINLVGELIITESIVKRLAGLEIVDEFDPINDALEQLSRNVHNLQDTALSMRMLPVSFSLARLPRIVRELSKELGKEATLELRGEQTEVDKTILEKISDPLIHLVRNAIDHGIEPVRDRLAAGKPAKATIQVDVYHQGGTVVLKVNVVDEATELTDREIHDLIFSPGFTTATEVTDVSGRGVGLDVVRRNIQDLGGFVAVESIAGKGSKFLLTLPLTLAIIDGQLMRIGSSTYIVPLLAIVENTQIDNSQYESIAGERNLYRFRDRVVPVLDLAEAWKIDQDQASDERRQIVMVESGGVTVGLLVNELLDQQQVVIKSLEKNFRAVAGISGATILGDGTVALILDIPGLVKYIQSEERRRQQEQGRNKAPEPSDS